VALHNATCQWVHRRDSGFYQAGKYTLVQRWKKNVAKDGDYVEK